MRRDEKLILYPMSRWDDLSEQLGGKRPSSGLMAIDLFRELGAGRIGLFGCD